MNYTHRLGFWSAILTAAFLGMGLFGSWYTEGIKYPYVLTTKARASFIYLRTMFNRRVAH